MIACSPVNDDKGFFPRGALAFFVAMIAFYAVFWLSLMALMISRR